MALRPGRTIRRVDKPAYTRYSKKSPRKSYIKAMPHQDIHQFRMGVKKEDYDVCLHLISRQDLQIRDNALESARQSVNKDLEKFIAGNYYFIVRKLPHQVIRENRMLAGAGADRLQKGMRMAFGRPVDKAARVYKDDIVFSLYTYSKFLPQAKRALNKARYKLPGNYKIVEEKVKGVCL